MHLQEKQLQIQTSYNFIHERELYCEDPDQMLLKTELSYWIGSIHQWQSICVREILPKILGRTFFSIKNSHTKQLLPNHADPAQCRLSAVP